MTWLATFIALAALALGAYRPEFVHYTNGTAAVAIVFVTIHNLLVVKGYKARATHDELTGIALNERAGLARLNAEVASAGPNNPLSITRFQLDGLEQVTKQLGSRHARAVIRSSAALAAGSLPEAHFLWRTADDGFYVVMPRTSETERDEFVKQLMSELRFYPVHHKHTILVSASIGAATLKEKEEATDLMKRAHESMLAESRVRAQS